MRMEKLEEQVAFLIAEVQELRKLKAKGGSERSGLGSPRIAYEQGSPGRRTEPRKVGEPFACVR